MKRRTSVRTNGSIAATRRGLNATWVMRRVRVWAGGSTFVSVGIERNPPSTSVRAAAGHGGASGARALAAENVSWSRSTRRTSA